MEPHWNKPRFATGLISCWVALRLVGLPSLNAMMESERGGWTPGLAKTVVATEQIPAPLKVKY